MEFKEILRDLRTEKNLTQKQLADELHFSMSTINKWENGKKDPSIDSIIALAKYFKVSAGYLIGLED